MSKDTTVEPKAVKAKVTTKSVGDERTVVAVVSSSNPDRDREIVDVASLRLPLKGGGFVKAADLTGNEPVDIPMLIDHSWSVEDTIGSVRKAYLNDAGEIVVEFGISSRAKAQDLMTLIDEGHLDNAFSITMHDYNWDDETRTISDAEVVEISLVFRGSNKDARLLAVKSLIKDEASTKTLEDKKADLAALTKEIEEEEAQAQAEETPETPAEQPEVQPEAEQPEPADTPEEPAPEAPEQSAPAEDPEVDVPQVTKSTKQETQSMPHPIVTKEVTDTPEVTPETDAPKEKQLDKYEFAAKQFSAFINGDSKALAELNAKAIESYGDAKSKDAILNAGTSADGGAIVPNAELLHDVYTTLGNYSTVSNDLRVITLTEGDALDVSTLVTDVVVSEVNAEGGKKKVTKPVLNQEPVSLREFAAIALITKKLVRQAAINIYDILRESFARAIANQRAVMALTDSSSGIANQTGIVSVTTAAGETTVDDVTVKEIKSMPYKVPVAAAIGGKYYISRELLEVLDSAEDSQGRPLNFVKLDGGNGLSGTFSNGYPFATEEVLGKAGAPHAVFGNMGRFGILLRQGAVESETFNTGTVNDGADGSNGTDHNLLQENKLAQRVAFYENVGYPLPGAFAVLELATA